MIINFIILKSLSALDQIMPDSTESNISLNCWKNKVYLIRILAPIPQRAPTIPTMRIPLPRPSRMANAIPELLFALLAMALI